jgi:hypothetical protein
VIPGEREEQEAGQLVADPRREPPTGRRMLVQMLDDEPRTASVVGFQPGSHRLPVIGADDGTAYP